MFDSAICCRMQLAAVSTVSCEALLDLKTVLQCALPPEREVVLQAQHPCLLSRGGADAKITEPTEGRPTQTISSMPLEPGLAGVRDSQDQYNRNPRRCQRTTVSGVTSRGGFFHPDHSFRRATQNTWSTEPNRRRVVWHGEPAVADAVPDSPA